MDCIPLTDLASVQLGILSNYVDVIQAVPQVQDPNELIPGHFCVISDICISFFPKIDSRITTRIVFSSCHATFNYTFNIFQSKVRFLLFHKELRHRRLGGLTLAGIHIIWGRHGLPRKFNPGLWKLNSRPLTKF